MQCLACHAQIYMAHTACTMMKLGCIWRNISHKDGCKGKIPDVFFVYMDCILLYTIHTGSSICFLPCTRKSIFGFMPVPTFPFREPAGTVRPVWQSPGMAFPSVCPAAAVYCVLSSTSKMGTSNCFFRQNGCHGG